MGRGYIVEDAVEVYLSKLCEQQTYPVIGLLIGQSSPQRDYVIMATRTPSKEESTSTCANSADKEWVTEHTRQVNDAGKDGQASISVHTVNLMHSYRNTLTVLNSKKICCQLFNSRPADWKYQSGVCSSWSTVSCCLNVDLLLPLPYSRARMETIDTCLKVGAPTHIRGAESVGTPDSEGSLSNRQKKAARGHGADNWTGYMNVHNTTQQHFS
uniref:Protein odr-4 homolog n=1 Tax=Mola mola TaxID=94237 RepID=A0A3Q3XHY0_MOLML